MSFFCSGTSTEMEQNIHVTKCLDKVCREISFIFPNYIYEPIYCPEQIKFCANNPLVETTITTLYDIVTNRDKDPNKSWKEKLAESLMSTNKSLPYISNQCCHSTNLNAQNIAQQTKITCFKDGSGEENLLKQLSSDMDLSKDCSSLNITTSSCVSCSQFDSDAECIRQTYEQPLSAIIKARTAQLRVQDSFSSSFAKTTNDGILKENEFGTKLERLEEHQILNEREGEIIIKQSNLIDDELLLKVKINENDISSKIQLLPAEFKVAELRSSNADVRVINEDISGNKTFDVVNLSQLSFKENKLSTQKISNVYDQNVITSTGDKERYGDENAIQQEEQSEEHIIIVESQQDDREEAELVETIISNTEV